MKKSLLSLLLMILVLSTTIAQDLIYTISGEINQNKTKLDSILVENLTNDTRILFGDLPEHDYYQINLTKNAYWGTVGINDIFENDIAFEVITNKPGKISISYLKNKSTEINVSIYNINGQKVYASTKRLINAGNSVDVGLSNYGVYFVKVETPQTMQTFKAIGVDHINQHSLKTSVRSSNKMTLKSSTNFTKGDFSFVLGDSIVITAYKNEYYAAPVAIKVASSQHINFLFEIVIYKPSVITATTTDIETNSVRLNGEVLSDGNTVISQRGFYWSQTNQVPGEVDNKEIVEGTTGSFNKVIGGLSPNTTYYYRAFAMNSEGTTTGDVHEFTTSQELSFPSVQTNAATDITSSSAKLGGEVSSDGNAEIIERGFYWSQTDQTPDDNDNKEIVDGTTGGFNKIINELQDNTTYYFRAFAVNSKGTAIGRVQSFKTPEVIKYLSLEVDTIFSDKEGGTYSVSINTNTSFTIDTTSNSASNIEEVKFTTIANDNEIIINVTPATVPFLSPKSILIKSDDESLYENLLVIQDGDFSNESSDEYINVILSQAASAFDHTHTIEAFYSNSFTTNSEKWSPFIAHNITSSNPEILDAWRALYKLNNILNSLQKAAGNNSIKYISSLRALLYYQLIVLWGDVPHITNFNNYDFFPSRTTTSEIYSSLQTQLRNCIEEMPEADSGSLFKVSKNVPRSLLAKILIQQEEYSEALLLIEDVISSGMYALNNDRNETLSSASTEIIYGINKNTFPTPNHSSIISGTYMPLIQYSELLLLAAECENNIGNKDSAINYLNQIRNRDGDNLASNESFETDLKETWKDNMIGRFSYFDFLKRKGLAVNELNIQEYKNLLPIPESEIILNPNMTQNPGY